MYSIGRVKALEDATAGLHLQETLFPADGTPAVDTIEMIPLLVAPTGESFQSYVPPSLLASFQPQIPSIGIEHRV